MVEVEGGPRPDARNAEVVWEKSRFVVEMVVVSQTLDEASERVWTRNPKGERRGEKIREEEMKKEKEMRKEMEVR